ncbi:uncharacterized protein LOC143372404 [Andrena cerasifolii]|uniref:uncharacterized protein LOC143372404 n=1 Tax=Andrena cerasifolii TaxID=2819439 RepID=UPI0040382C01
MGLPAEERSSLIKKYPPPSNCLFLDSPKLNAEVERSVNETVRTRDNRIIDKQERLGACISGLGKIISTLLLRDVADDLPVIECLSDVCRFIADSVHDESLLLANINNTMRGTLTTTAVHESLYGKNLSENLKSAKLLEQSAADLKVSKPPVFKSSKNSKGPLLRTQNRTYPTGSGGQKRTTTSSYRNQEPRHAEQPQRTRQSTYRSSQRKHYSKRR